MKCPILEEVRRVKRECAAKFDYDFQRMGEEARRVERLLGVDVVTISRTGEVTILYKAPRKLSPKEFAENAMRVFAEADEKLAKERGQIG
jgi:hypothetical protein